MVARPKLAVAALVLAPITLGFTLFVVAAPAQTAEPVARVFHPTPPLLSYEVATIKPDDPGGQTAATGMRGSTISVYVRGAYSPAGGLLPPTQVVGGPQWIDKERYVIVGKPPSDLELAMQKMNLGDRAQQNRVMQQSLLATRFHLKVHFEVREMPIYTLVPAKGGFKIKVIADPASPAPEGQQSSPATGKRPSAPAGAIQLLSAGANGGMIRAHAISMAQLAGVLGSLVNQSGSGYFNAADTGGRPVVDQTGFSGNFDIDALKWSSPQSAGSDTPSDVPSFETALEETLGLRLVATKGPVEVVVIDSIDHPSEN